MAAANGRVHPPVHNHKESDFDDKLRLTTENLPRAGRMPRTRRCRPGRSHHRLGTGGGHGRDGESQTITARAQVKAIDLGARMVTLVGPEGNVFDVHVSDAVRNLDKVKVGDSVVAKYYASIVLYLSSPGTKIPEDQATAAAARAPKGHVPAAVLNTRTVVTGTVVGVDLAAHTISLVAPSGGLVHTFAVTDPRRQAALKRVKSVTR